MRVQHYRKDDLPHYLGCPVLWDIINSVYPLPSSNLHPLQLLCLRFADSDPNPMIIAHHVYHSVRHKFSASLPNIGSLAKHKNIIEYAMQVAAAAASDIP